MKEEQLYEEFFKKDEKKVDYKAIIFEYLLHWPFIVVFLLLSVIFAYVYLRYQAPVYSVTSSVMIKQGDKTKSTAATALASMQDLGTMSMANNFDNEVEIIQSYSLIKKVVESKDFYISYVDENKFRYDTPAYKNVPVSVWMAPGEAERLPSVDVLHAFLPLYGEQLSRFSWHYKIFCVNGKYGIQVRVSYFLFYTFAK